MEAVEKLASDVGTKPACEAIGFSRAGLYRQRLIDKAAPVVPKRRSAPPRALTMAEEQEVLDILHTERFQDKAPHEVYATLLDEGRYLCSIRTFYRILEKNSEVKERRNQLSHPIYTKPELLATGPNQVWSWDITKLLGPQKWSYFYLYVILDIFSRYVVGWMVATCELSSLAKRLIMETCEKQGIIRDQLTIHADRGSSMKSKPVTFLMADLGITKTHSRPYTSDDNPYSEAQFKTLKYRPEFPDRFGSIQDARQFCQSFFPWYNQEHHHTGISLLTPESLHYGKAETIIKERQLVLNAAYAAHPERFVKKMPAPQPAPKAAWINKPNMIAADLSIVGGELSALGTMRPTGALVVPYPCG